MIFSERNGINHHRDTTPQLTFESKDCLVFLNQVDGELSTYISFSVAFFFFCCSLRIVIISKSDVDFCTNRYIMRSNAVICEIYRDR